MKKVMSFILIAIAYIMLALIWLASIIYYTSLWGGIGFFGALFTTPISTGIYVFIYLISGVSQFIGTVIYFGIIFIAFWLASIIEDS